MTVTTVKRSDLKHYLDVLPSGTASWKQINQGVTSATINWNPKVEEEGYIGETSKSKTTTGFAPEMPLDMSGKSDDDAYKFVWEIIWLQKVGSAAETDMLIVDASAAAVGGAYPAQKQHVSVSYESTGGDALLSLKNGITLQFMGDPEVGTYNPTSAVYAKTA
jgi:hypothetical protein